MGARENLARLFAPGNNSFGLVPGAVKPCGRDLPLAAKFVGRYMFSAGARRGGANCSSLSSTASFL